MTDTEPAVERTAPPPLEPRLPLCSVCGYETEQDWRGNQLKCASCGCSWDAADVELEGVWEDAAADQCPETVTPYLDNPYIKADDKRKHLEFRCLLDAGHDSKPAPVGTDHANQDMKCSVKGWN